VPELARVESETPALAAKVEAAEVEFRAIPVGVVEISDQQTRFIPIHDGKKLTGALVAGIGLGMWLARRRRH
jgi:hypothetical protein